ncbi:MAG: B12-binding domain-containing radical SAM protein [Lentisphaerae bacterium]|nr:B12-binding domain-containing radical SAM protein [Lentisphaerota bacterium]
MKILIGYPPTVSSKGIATLGQNRQFQWFSNPSFLFPVVPASAATLLKSQGHDVTWLDCVAERIQLPAFLEILRKTRPELLAFETKTPVIKQHWRLINQLKDEFPDMLIALYGDHVTSFPEESMRNSTPDYVICGGDYDFVLARLLETRQTGQTPPDGVFYRRDGHIHGNRNFCTNHDLDTLPFIDRDLTKWRLYEREYNFVRHPYFYIMSSRDCWWGKCKFCSWPRMYPNFRTRSVPHVLDEIGMLTERYGAREIFDDAGTLRTGAWLKELCLGLTDRGYHRRLRYSCNMRFGALGQDEYHMMKQAGFRLLKFGLESANQNTLDRLDKGIRVEDITRGCAMARAAGLTVHLTMIIGYPWETMQDALRTFNLARELMQSGKADLLQATVLIPYPGTPLWEEARQNAWFLFDPEDYERYDMREPVLSTADSDARRVADICGRTYTVFLTPRYLWSRLKSIRSLEDLQLNLRGIPAVVGHLREYIFAP